MSVGTNAPAVAKFYLSQCHLAGRVIFEFTAEVASEYPVPAADDAMSDGISDISRH